MRIACVNKGVGSAAGAKNGWKTFSKWNFSLKPVFFGACGEQLFPAEERFSKTGPVQNLVMSVLLRLTDSNAEKDTG